MGNLNAKILIVAKTGYLQSGNLKTTELIYPLVLPVDKISSDLSVNLSYVNLVREDIKNASTVIFHLVVKNDKVIDLDSLAAKIVNGESSTEVYKVTTPELDVEITLSKI